MITVTGSESRAEDGDFVSANDALDTTHSYFIEVPEGATIFELDLFDIDMLFGIDDGSNTEQVAERDRIRRYADYIADPVANNNDRVGMTLVKYELFDPSGSAVVTKYIHGSHFAPSGADGAWLNFYDSALADTSSGDQWLDQFGTAAYTNNNGSENFAAGWVEDEQAGVNGCGTSAGAAAGLIRITGGRLRITDDCDFGPDTGREPRITRELDLATGGYTSAVLSMDFEVTAQIEKPDAIVLEVSDDGGTSWTTLDAFTSYEGAVVSGSRAYDISDFIATDTQIRFRVENLFAGSSEHLFIDNFEIRATANAASSPDAGHWELRIDASSAANDIPGSFNGDETNAFGIRAHDGDASSSGAEYNVYTFLHTAGVNPNDSSRDYTFYGLISHGCDFDVNDFDWDADLASNTDPDPDLDPPFGSLAITSPDGSFTSASTLSANDTWASNTASGWTDDDTALQYGIWPIEMSIEDPVDGNYTQIYIGDDDDTGPDPTVIPEPDALRIYLPTDGDTAPAKPYLYQGMTTFASEPNPPGVGQTAVYNITVGVVNPDGSIGDIEFDGVTNVVTANVPAGPTYQGVVILDQGSIVSQPVVGSTTGGDIVWNPGTLAAGSGSDTRARMVYRLELAGQAGPYSVDITGAPGSGSGTRATWLDETDTAFSTGELCNMRVTSAAATPVVISEVEVWNEAGEVVLTWSTASEAAALEFEIYRGADTHSRPERVHATPLTALLDRPGGGSYRLRVADTPSDTASAWWIVETTSANRQVTYGPYVRTPRLGPPPTLSEIGFAGDGLAGYGLEATNYGRRPHAIDEAFAQRRQRWRSSTDISPAQLDEKRDFSLAQRRGASRMQILVDETGLQLIGADQIAAGLGLDLPQAQNGLRRNAYDLEVGGQRVAWSTDPNGEAMEIYGVALDTPYSDTNVYNLRIARGLAWPRAASPAPPPDWQIETFTESLWLEENLRPIVVLDIDPESDTWFWGFVRSGTAEENFDVAAAVPSATGLGDAKLRVHLQGAAAGEHVVEIRWNGTLLGQAQLNDNQSSVIEVAVDSSDLAEIDNILQVRGVSGSLVFLQGFELTYERRLEAVNDSLEVVADRDGIASATGFTHAAVRVLDISQARRPVPVAARVLVEPSSHRVLWQQREGARYLLVAEGAQAEPATRVDSPSDLLASQNRADYLVIAAPGLESAAASLASYRQSRGLLTQVVSVNDIYDEMNHGVVDPRAIRDFLAHAHTEWDQAPRLAVLLGHGTYDFRDYLGYGDNLIPPLLWNRGDSLYPTDALFGDFDQDGAPEIVVGRIPALDNAEAEAYLSKVEAYESTGDSAWNHRLLFLADHADASGSFTSESQALGELLPSGFEPLAIHLDEAPDIATARQDLQDELTTGAAWMHYTGHGGLDRLSSSQLLSSSDVPGLPDHGRLPLFSAISCTVGLHALPGIDSLAEQLVIAEDRGVIAALAPAWLSENQAARLLGDRLVRNLFEANAAAHSRGESGATVGDVFRQALESTSALGLPIDLSYAYQLLGDPALEIQLHAEPPAAGCDGECGNG